MIALLAAVLSLLKQPEPLFDGKTLTGWEARPTSKAGSSGEWKVENGAIVCTGKEPGWLASNESFRDFRLHVEFLPQEKTNSGIFLRSKKDGQPHVTGYELQIWDFQPAGFLSGSLAGTAKAKNPARLKPGQWNTYDVEVRGDRFRIRLNGQLTLDTRDTKSTEGVIGFQCQIDNPISFRNIRIRRR
jgi:hypothetical protein